MFDRQSRGYNITYISAPEFISLEGWGGGGVFGWSNTARLKSRTAGSAIETTTGHYPEIGSNSFPSYVYSFLFYLFFRSSSREKQTSASPRYDISSAFTEIERSVPRYIRIIICSCRARSSVSSNTLNNIISTGLGIVIAEKQKYIPSTCACERCSRRESIYSIDSPDTTKITKKIIILLFVFSYCYPYIIFFSLSLSVIDSTGCSTKNATIAIQTE